MRHRIAVVVGLVLLMGFILTGRLEAATACYTRVCNDSTYACSFDASCSTWTGNLWRFRWDFGDGSGFYFTGSATINHTYSMPYPDVELMVIPLSEEPASVSCGIVVFNNVGPPLPTEGECP